MKFTEIDLFLFAGNFEAKRLHVHLSVMSISMQRDSLNYYLNIFRHFGTIKFVRMQNDFDAFRFSFSLSVVFVRDNFINIDIIINAFDQARASMNATHSGINIQTGLHANCMHVDVQIVRLFVFVCGIKFYEARNEIYVFACHLRIFASVVYTMQIYHFGVCLCLCLCAHFVFGLLTVCVCVY